MEAIRQPIVRFERDRRTESVAVCQSIDPDKPNLEDKSFDWVHRMGRPWDNRTFDTKFMPHLDWIWERQNRVPVLLASSAIVLAIAVVDWWTKPYFSLGFLYLFPIMLAAGFLPRWAIILLGLACALLSERFSNLDPSDANIRLGFEALALCGCGLLTSEVLRNKRLSFEAQERMRVLVETSPAAIVTVDERGFIELANQAANELMAPRDGHLIGQPIAAFPAGTASRVATGGRTPVPNVDAVPRTSRQRRVFSRRSMVFQLQGRLDAEAGRHYC